MNAENFQYMSLALQLAERGCFSVSPNPMVGCVIVKNNQIVGRGFHQFAGGPHAEIYALEEAGEKAHGATLFVTLEPCCHSGKTPPCVGALIKAGIKEIYAACLDPNPEVSGKGVEQLRAAGITVHIGLLEKEARKLNEIFFYFISHKRPFVIAKWAMSLDGKTIVNQPDSREISSAESLYHCHQVRRKVDAILVGAATARLDNPELTARFKPDDEVIAKQPIRIVLSSEGRLPLDLKIFSANSSAQTMIATTNAVDQSWQKALALKNIEVLVLPQDKNQKVHLPSLLDALAKKNITSLLVEGGTTVQQSFFKEDLVNKIDLYLCPVIISSLEKKQKVHNLDLTKVGRDFYLSADYKEENLYV